MQRRSWPCPRPDTDLDCARLRDQPAGYRSGCGAGLHSRIRSAGQGTEAARFPLRRPDDGLRDDAGDRPGQRPFARMLGAQPNLRRAERGRAQTPPTGTTASPGGPTARAAASRRVRQRTALGLDFPGRRSAAPLALVGLRHHLLFAPRALSPSAFSRPSPGSRGPIRGVRRSRTTCTSSASGTAPGTRTSSPAATRERFPRNASGTALAERLGLLPAVPLPGPRDQLGYRAWTGRCWPRPSRCWPAWAPHWSSTGCSAVFAVAPAATWGVTLLCRLPGFPGPAGAVCRVPEHAADRRIPVSCWCAAGICRPSRWWC